MSPPTSTLERILDELLHHIRDYLNDKSFPSFALASKRCLAAANVRLFRNIEIRILGRARLQFDLEHWESRLRRASSFKYVRKLDIRGYMPRERDDTSGIVNIPFVPDFFFPDDEPPSVVQEEDRTWEPMATFIRQLPALTDLPRPPWHGFSLLTKAAVNRCGSLIKLELRHDDIDEIFKWHDRTNLSTLEYLEIEANTRWTMAAIRWMKTYNFDSLKTLILRSWNFEQDETSHQACNSFLRSLRPLKTLELEINADLTLGTVEAIVGKHGPSLQKLSLAYSEGGNTFVIPLTHIEKIHTNCPLVEELKVAIPRSKEMSKRPPVENVAIKNDSSFNESEQEMFSIGGTPVRRGPRNGHIRDDWMNCAIDETLARSIFEVISSARGQSGYPLEHLELVWTGTSRLGIDDLRLLELDWVRKVIARDWFVDRNPRDDMRNEFLVTARDAEYAADVLRMSPRHLDPSLDAVFRSV
ncbi:uncharacterized protein PAC_19166 [Phialocephala subalpina]|uniref:F-box domain-containing protein n=1 Tax=Phialocephala subalpina TaxID=576137 RepID=A0A1L7XW70_9HELO|nr:uncharacterized protein PAC_19166 [Phialocephala subalpina]